jgi:hypothetical protein
MKRIPVTSSAVVSAGYDAHARELELEFRGGRVYRYLDVPGDVFQFLLRTSEKGRYVNTMIAPNFTHRDVSKAQRARPESQDDDMTNALEASLQRKKNKEQD